MADVQALDMDVVTEKSGHSVVGMAVSVCITPAAPAPLPMPYPLTATVSEGIADSPLRTKVSGTNCATIGSVLKTCHGNEPGTLKEVVSLNTGGPCAPLTGAFTVLIELGPAAITGSLCDMNKAPTPGAGSNASDAGGSGGGGGGGGAGGGAGGAPGGPNGPGGGGGGGGGSGSGASAPGSSSSSADEHQCQGGHPVNLATGGVVDQATDLELPGIISLAFRRYYSSFRHSDVNATLGPGWAHGFEQRIEMGERTCDLRDGQGRWIYFDRIAVGESSFHRAERLTLSRPDDRTFRVYEHEERITRVFEPVQPGRTPVLRRIEDPYGNAIVFEYRAGKLARVVDTAGRSINVAWRSNRLASLSVAAGGAGCVVAYEYSRAGYLIAVTDPLGHTERYTYDGRGRMIATTTKTGAPFAYEYDGDTARCVASYGPDGLFEVHLERDPAKQTTFVDGEEPRIVVWNEKGLVEKLLLPDGTLLDEAAYDQDGLLIAQANGAGEGWKYWYDDRGRPVRAMDPCQQVTTFEYAGDWLVRMVRPDGNVTKYSYDDKGSLVAVEWPGGERYFLRYDERGRFVEGTSNIGPVVTREYDSENNVVAETDARGARTTYRYDGLGNMISMRDALGRETRMAVDALGRRTLLQEPDGATTRYDYDASDHLTREVDPLGRTIRYEYAGLNALARVVTADGQAWTLEHTKEERISAIVNPLGERYAFERDLAGRVVVEKTFDGRELRYARDAAGRVERILYPDGSDRSYVYDRAGRLIKDSTRDDTRTFTRDPVGRLLVAALEDAGGRHETRFERDGFGQMIGEAQGDRRTRWEIDVLGRRTSRVLPNGATTRYTYEADDSLISVDHDGFRLEFERDLLGRETARTHAGGLRIASRYDAADRLIEQQAIGRGADGSLPRALVERRWTYDRAGRVERIDDSRWGTTTYAYDDVDQLLEARRGTISQQFRYDAAGSILEALEELGGGRRSVEHEVGPGNVLLRAGNTKYAYDKLGRRVGKVELAQPDAPQATQYSWDVRDQLRTVALTNGTRVTLTYDALGRRLRKETTPQGRERARVREYVWDLHVLAMDVDSIDGARVFVHSPDSFIPLLQQEHGEVFTYLVDHLGTAKELITADGRVAWSAAHGAWGDVRAEHSDTTGAASGRAARSPFRLMGHISDEELGLTFTRFRVFDAGTGRWLSPDPAGIEGGPNLYALDAAPTIVVDPFGLATTSTAGGSHPARLKRDAAVGKTPPPALPLNRPVGKSATQNQKVQDDIKAAKKAGGKDFRVNQQQVDANGNRVGLNRPDLQYTDKNGKRQYVEYDKPPPVRAPGHATRIGANDPNNGGIDLQTVP